VRPTPMSARPLAVATRTTISGWVLLPAWPPLQAQVQRESAG
jgi:hypothetical protein